MKAYSFQDGVLTVGGIIITGEDSAQDNIIIAKRRADVVFPKMTSDGQMVVGLNSDKSGTITINMVQGMPVNALLGALQLLQSTTATFTSFPIGWLEVSTGNTFFAANCTFQTLPEMARGMAPGIQTWVFLAEDLTLFFGV